MTVESGTVVLVMPSWLMWLILGLSVANIGANAWRAYLLHKAAQRNRKEQA
jgi:hypothetical protein